MSSSSPSTLKVSPVVLTIPAGHRAATYAYEGLNSGSYTITASALQYKTESRQIDVVTESPATTLREAGERRGLLMGAAAMANEFGYPDPLITEPAYAATLGAQFNMLEPENAMKWIVVHPGQDRYDFGPADRLVNFAIAHHMKVRGHTLCWGVANPEWLKAYRNAPANEVSELLHRHIQTVVSHYRGKVFAWDVVNEALDDKATGSDIRLQDTIWYNQPGIGLHGTGYIEQAFRWAHAADPDALLFYNENNILMPGGKFDGMYRMLADFVTRGVPINGVGFQVHIGLNGYPKTEGLARNIRSITALGLQAHLTEVDVAIPVDKQGKSTMEDLKAQADTYRRILEICLRNPRCTAFQTWGFTDKRSWVPDASPGLGAALPFDSNYLPKPAYNAMMKALSGKE